MRLTSTRPLVVRPCPASARRAVAAAVPEGGGDVAMMGRRAALAAALSLSSASLLLARPAGASALDQAPAPLPFPADAIPYNLSIPTGWVSASGVSPGGAGRPTLAWFPADAGAADGASVSLLATPVGADYTSLGSFGDAGGFAANLIASSDQSFRLRGRGGKASAVDPVSVQTAALLDAREVTARNGSKIYRVDYLLKRAGEAEPRTLYTAVAMGPDPNGRGFTNALYTLTAQASAAALGAAPALAADLVRAVESFEPPVFGKGGR